VRRQGEIVVFDNWSAWLPWLEITLGLLVIAFEVLVKGNFLGIPINAMFRLAGVLMGTGILLMSLSNLLGYVESATWSRVDRDHAFVAETMLGIFGSLLLLVALAVLARSRADTGRRQV
jgi:hypothetical protein